MFNEVTQQAELPEEIAASGSTGPLVLLPTAIAPQIAVQFVVYRKA